MANSVHNEENPFEMGSGNETDSVRDYDHMILIGHMHTIYSNCASYTITQYTLLLNVYTDLTLTTDKLMKLLQSPVSIRHLGW